GGNSWSERKNLLFAGGDLPDAFYGHGILNETVEIVKYGSKGAIIPLEGLIGKYAPNVRSLFAAHPEYKRLLTAPDGHIYSLPTINEAYAVTKPALFINKRWLDSLGLPLPGTTEEFARALMAFKSRDMNGNGLPDEISFTFMASDRNADLASFFGSFGQIDRRDHLALVNGKVVYTATQPEYKGAIEYFHLLFGRGLVDPESFTQNSKVYSAKISRNNAVGAFVAWNTNSVGLPDDSDYVPLPPLAGPDGDQMWAGFEPGILFKGSFAITSANRHPDLTMRWIDSMYDPLVSMQAVHGMIGSSLTELPDGNYKSVSPPPGADPETFRGVPETSRTVWAVTWESEANLIPVNRRKSPKSQLDKLYEPFLVYNEYPKIYFTEAENDQISRYMTDIATYADQMYAKWMVSGGIEQEWNGYLRRLNDMGLSSLLNIYQEAYDRYQANTKVNK
ncbi:MAG: extracellular solute-binding protein, partial [Paenibacillaceae bacterium]|nr:extracellular solute-binding protein [Paenibacillaceae bacterium]